MFVNSYECHVDDVKLLERLVAPMYLHLDLEKYRSQGW